MRSSQNDFPIICIIYGDAHLLILSSLCFLQDGGVRLHILSIQIGYIWRNNKTLRTKTRREELKNNQTE